MMIHRTFTRRTATPIRERRRRRWSDTFATIAAIAGVALDQAARSVEAFPPSWHPYIRAAALAFGAVAMLERIERRHDYKRYVRRITRETTSNETSGDA